MATTLTSAGTLSGAASAGTPSPVALNSTFCAAAPFVAETTGTNVLFNFANNGAMVFVIWNTVASGSGNTWEPVMFPNTSGAPAANTALLGVTLGLTTMVYTTTATLGAFILGPFGPSKFNDSNGLCWINQVSAGLTTSYVGVMALPGAVT
jgi:hypothetical protein